MKRLTAILCALLLAGVAPAADVVLGSASGLQWTGSGTTRIATWAAVTPAWTPPTNCIFWVEADSGVVLNGVSLTNWTDKSGVGNHATNYSGTATVRTNRINGLPVVHFNGTNSWLFTAANPGAGAHTIIFIAAVTGFGVSDGYEAEMSYWAKGTDRGAPHFLKDFPNITAASYPIYATGGFYDGVGSYSYNTFYMFALPLATGSWTAWKNGASEATSSASSYPNDTVGMKLGNHYYGSTRWWCGDLAAVFYFSRKLSNAEVNNVQSYLSTKYGISVAQLP